jgi:hypothetical protein
MPSLLLVEDESFKGVKMTLDSTGRAALRRRVISMVYVSEVRSFLIVCMGTSNGALVSSHPVYLFHGPSAVSYSSRQSLAPRNRVF